MAGAIATALPAAACAVALLAFFAGVVAGSAVAATPAHASVLAWSGRGPGGGDGGGGDGGQEPQGEETPAPTPTGGAAAVPGGVPAPAGPGAPAAAPAGAAPRTTAAPSARATAGTPRSVPGILAARSAAHARSSSTRTGPAVTRAVHQPSAVSQPRHGPPARIVAVAGAGLALLLSLLVLGARRVARMKVMEQAE